MPRQDSFSREIRELIVGHYERGKSPEEVFAIVFLSNPHRASLGYLKWLFSALGNADFNACYASGPHPERRTRDHQRKLSPRAQEEIMRLQRSNPHMTIRALTLKFNEYWYGKLSGIERAIVYASVSTIRRVVVVRHRWSRKVMERRHRDRSPGSSYVIFPPPTSLSLAFFSPFHFSFSLAHLHRGVALIF